jgi:cation transport regulator ChaC
MGSGRSPARSGLGRVEDPKNSAQQVEFRVLEETKEVVIRLSGRGDQVVRSEDAVPWIFGYGSLIWRPSFPHAERRPARLAGWSRRFWQGSTDHRGVPGAPGRVVTLVREAGALCWGMAYRLEAARRAEVLALLDHREQGGYERNVVELELELEPESAEPEPPSAATSTNLRSERFVSALVYVATPANPNYLGPASLDEIALQVAGARGPSGDNREYVVRLAETLREHGARDSHVFELAARLSAA